MTADAGSELREYLREWRRAAAKQQGVPAFVVMHDTSLDELCRKRPGSMPELLRISGFGEHKAGLYGQQIFDVFSSGSGEALAPALLLRQSLAQPAGPVVYDGECRKSTYTSPEVPA